MYGGAPAFGPTDGIARLERAALNAVPAPRVAWDGPFVVRAFRGGTGRGNAACSLDPASDPGLEARVARIEAHYTHLGLPARFRSTPLDPPGLVELLQARGYREVEGAVILAGTLPPIEPEDAEWADAPTHDWLSVLATAEHQTQARRQEKVEAVPLLSRPAAWLVLRRDGQPAAVGHAVADDGLLGIFDVATAPAARRTGLGRAVLGALAGWGMARGATRCWLQVAPSNAPALTLYAGSGMTEVYRYRYLVRY
ncbi:GNAT family N-acetyltransferase [Roseomonas sp. CCTCC AB2023176]|uniref:GNAT family N-acetyltransferase n=1 Tax=Roseomonas sp. CCTCC AB2023176 TaxID=3342640 RepID=UPI0035DCB276